MASNKTTYFGVKTMLAVLTSVEEYLKCELSSQIKHELIDGQV